MSEESPVVASASAAAATAAGKKLSKREKRALQFKSAVKGARKVVSKDEEGEGEGEGDEEKIEEGQDEDGKQAEGEDGAAAKSAALAASAKKFSKREKEMSAEEYAAEKKARKEAQEKARAEKKLVQQSKKRKAEDAAEEQVAEEEGPKLSKKQRKARNKEIALQQQQEKEQKQQAKKEKEASGNGARFILFLGNLPYSATEASLAKHLEASNPDLIRLPTDKTTKKVKGFAFAEFVGTDASRRMKVCLRLHHTEFKGRKINVELTAGGGGKSESRLQKLRVKNEKLEEERKGIIAESKNQTKTSGTAVGAAAPKQDGVFVHPSRMAQVGS